MKNVRRQRGQPLCGMRSKGTLLVLAEGFLAEKGIYLGNIDGIFGTGMEEAVRRFQTITCWKQMG